MKFIIEHRYGLIGTTLFHTILLLILIFFGFKVSAPVEPPKEESIMINFGTDNAGSGTIEPSSAQESVSEPQNKVKVVNTNTTQNIMTSNVDNSVAVKTSEKIKNKEIKVEKVKEDVKEVEEPVEKREVNKKVLFKGSNKGSGLGKSNSGNSTSEGENGGNGNQGSIDGNIHSTSHVGSKTGNGTTYSLAGRKAYTLPVPTYKGNEEGIVVVEVKVNQQGKVVKASPGKKGSTTSDASLFKLATEAALKAEFNIDNNAAELQTGTITYRFVLK